MVKLALSPRYPSRQRMAGPVKLPRSNKDSGSEAEKQAAHWLTEQGLIVVARNFRCRQGEIDLIMQDGDT
ncbi:YraN family protein, partial [Alcanivorax sp. HI0003]|uniref:YraN family protein n=1 Tax=Alcanivorax sp. HI0003 TaxID=1822217 RepID=UPI0035103CD1